MPATRPMPAGGILATASPPDPRLVFAPTQAGLREREQRSRRISIGAHRLLMWFDGRKPVAELPGIVRPGELPALLRELAGEGMIRLVDSGDGSRTAVHPDAQLSRIKQALAGAFERELGPQAVVIEARVQDCVNLFVLRKVLDEVIGLVAARRDAAAAARVAAIVQPFEPF